jgi:DNA-binding protein HU-beta
LLFNAWVEGQKIAGDKGGITTKRNQRAPGGRTKRFYREAIDEILEGIEHQLSQGKKVSFLGFGTFYTRIHKGGKARNFHTGNVVNYKDVRLAAFRPGTLLKQAVRRKKDSSSNLPPFSAAVSASMEW